MSALKALASLAAISMLPMTVNAHTGHQQHTTPTATATATALATLPPLPEAYAAANQRLHENTSQLRGNAAILSAGEPIPAFALYDQEAKPVLIPKQWQDKYIIISFIFTRCKVATMCPAATAKMTALQRALDEKGLSGQAQFLSISFDPRYDSPAVLKQYANLFGANTENYSFLTGQEQTIQDLLRRFGVLTQQEDGTINHSMATVLIAPGGTLSQRQIGSDWKIDPFLYEIETETRNKTTQLSQ